MTDPMPIMIPSMVRKERILLALRAERAIFIFSISIPVFLPGLPVKALPVFFNSSCPSGLYAPIGAWDVH